MVASLAASLAVLPLAYFAVALDNWAAISLDWWFYPFFLGSAALLLAAAWLPRRWRLFVALLAPFVSLLIALRLADFSPVKPFVRAARAIRPGMTSEQARAIVDREFPPDGRFRPPVEANDQTGNLGYCLDPTDGRYNAAILEVSLKNGRVASVHFSPD